MRNKIFILFFLFIGCINREKTINLDNSFCLNNSQDAIKVAEKEWFKRYGENIYNKKPFKAEIKNDSIWVITGSLPEDYDGGVPYAEINAKNCKILSITHGK
ncbi:YbbC/YhhH family protein [Flavobacterium gelatinilyticum]|uniref:YbbC/YhhH family protein n=1 Tax=Flavobacterium gelatinilyticum TaxID=3003260 RepID=UPI00247FD902|nr:YbbC/YhhH family protein [Flavobacterium gelatinilyticum]